MKYVILVGDGMGDYPVAELGGRTPLEAAATPHLESIRAIGNALRADALQGVSEQDAAIVFEVLRKMRSNLTGH